MADDMKLSADPTSTWGASDEYKAAWNEKYGNVSPGANASKGEWVEFAKKTGKSESEAEAMTRDELVEEYGAGVPFSAPSVPNESTAAGTGEAPGTTGTPTTGTSTPSTTTR